MRAFAFVIAFLFAAMAFGQTAAETNQERVLYLAHTESTQDFRAIVTAVRVLANIRQISTDDAQRALTLHGTPGQIALAGWLVNELDKPQQAARPATYEFRVADGSGDLARIYYLARATTPLDLQEIATLVRSTADIQRVYVYAAQKAVMVRANPVQVAMADWLVGKLDTSEPPSGAHEFRVPGATDDVMRVFFLEHASRPEHVQEMATLLRSIADIQRLFVYNAPKAVALRATGDRVALAAWLVNELDQPENQRDTAIHEYRLPSGVEDVTRVFYIARSATPQQVREIASEIRRTAGIRRLFVYNARNAVAARGSAEQIAAAQQLVSERH